jgi:lysophospholipase L1-like esterase
MRLMPPESSSHAHVTLAWCLLFAAVCQWAPGLDALRFLPDDPARLLPRLVRLEADPLPWASPAQSPTPAAVDDDALLAEPALIDAPVSTAVPDSPGGLKPTPAAAVSVAASADPRPIPVRGGFTEASALPAPPAVRDGGAGVPLLPIEDPHGVLERFYDRLREAAAGRAQVRVVHYGDSLITGDYITETMRRLMQKKFGDGGHGFVLAGLTSPWYRRNHLDIKASEGWHTNRLTKPTVPDGRYGLGGVTFRTREAGEWVTWSSAKRRAKDETLNAGFTRLEVWYWGQGDGGRFALEVDGEAFAEVSTRDAGEGAQVKRFQLSDGPHKVRLKTLGGGEVRLFGAVLEREAPGVVYDSLGVDGTRVKLLSRFDGRHWAEQLRARQVDLVVLHYGTNEGEAADLGTKNYREDLRPVVQQLRASLPSVPCLLVGPMDRAERDEHGELVSRPVVERIATVQRRVAYMDGCAFFDTYRAMGGEGSMAVWARTGLGGGDFTHPTKQGADRVGAMLFSSLMDGYRHRDSPH